MNLTKVEALNIAIVDEVARHNHVFTLQAIEQWDKDGEGNFDKYVAAYAACCWDDLARLN